MRSFAFNLGMQSKQPTIWTQLQGDCCSATGVDCNGSQRVYKILWYSMGLNGSLNGTAIPSTVDYLGVYRNQITGPIPSQLPVGLITLYVDGNLMSGDLPSFPPSLKYFDLGFAGTPGNHFSGTLRLNQPVYLHINDNWITDVVIQDSSQINPSNCDLSNNPLLGNPGIAGLIMCTKIGLYSAGLLPVTKTTLILTKSSSTSTTGTFTNSETAVLTTANAIVRSTSTIARQVTSSGLFLDTTIIMTLMEPNSTTNEMTAETTKLVKCTNTAAEDATSTEMDTRPNAVGTSKIQKIETGGILSKRARRTTLTGTILFYQQTHLFSLKFGTLARCIISAMFLTWIMKKTPLKRELKRMIKKKEIEF